MCAVSDLGHFLYMAKLDRKLRAKRHGRRNRPERCDQWNDTMAMVIILTVAVSTLLISFVFGQ